MASGLHRDTVGRIPAVALIEDDLVQLQLYKAQLTKYNCAVTVFNSGAEFLSHISGEEPTSFDAVIIDYHMPGLNAIETIARLEQRFRQTCKICVISGNRLSKADRTTLEGQSIRVVQKNQGACPKIVELLCSPDRHKCSSCTRWKPVVEFSGRATCDACRLKKREQSLWARKNQSATCDLLQAENEQLRSLVMTHNEEILALRSQVSMHQEIINRLQSERNGSRVPTVGTDPVTSIHQQPK